MKIEHDVQELGKNEQYSVLYPRLQVLHIVSNASHAYYKEAAKLGNKKLVALHQNHMIDELAAYVCTHVETSEKTIKDKIYREMARHNLRKIG